MPNYCNNVVEIRGPVAQVKALVDHKLDFQKIHPYPPELDITAGREGADDSPEQKALVAAEESNLKKYGYKNWYDWCVNNWGTKWNAGGDNDAMMVDYDEDQGDQGTALFQFDTAWAPPLGVLEKLMDTHPELSIECRYHEPGVGFFGVWTDGSDRCYEFEKHIEQPDGSFVTVPLTSKDALWNTDDGRLLDEHFGLVEQLQESEANQETEAERMVRELIVDKKAQNIAG
jgi:hypothetical protein